MRPCTLSFLGLLILTLGRTSADPVPTGGALCMQNGDCGLSGVCQHRQCVCPAEWAKPDCTYKRYSARTAGWLQIVLSFLGVGGVGNLMIGNDETGGWEMMMTLSAIFLIPVAFCGVICTSINPVIGALFVSIFSALVTLTGMAGLLWSLIDGVRMLMGSLLDGQGFRLY